MNRRLHALISGVCGAILSFAVGAAETVSVDSLPKITSLVDAGTGRLYAATEDGLFASQDSGKSWRNTGQFRLPVTLLARNNNKLYAFVVGEGLLVKAERDAEWQVLNNQFGSQVLQQISFSGEQLYAVNQFGSLLSSEDAGTSWRRVWPERALTDEQSNGKQLFEQNCQACHGIEGVGETYTLEALTTKDYLMAPPLNDFTHAWHHTDEQIVKTILEGSPRKSRMVGWQGRLSEPQAKEIVAYIKTLWGPKALECQGPKHMQCM